MRESDKKAFAALLTDVANYYDRKLTASTMRIYWQGLEDVPMESLRLALSVHAKDPVAGSFMPKISDINRALQALQSDDGHPGAEEAWSIALQARHESAAVVWTEQISQAFFTAALPLLDEGDKIAARKAFQERYERELADARRDHQPAKWFASLGTDAKQCEQAVDQAVRLGRITEAHAQKLLPRSEPVTANAMQAIENGVRATAASAEEAKEKMAALKAMLRLQ